MGEDNTFRNNPQAKEQYTLLNDTADAVMRKHGIIINDLYSTVADDLDNYISGDNVHFNSKGVAVQAEQVAKIITEALHPHNP